MPWRRYTLGDSAARIGVSIKTLQELQYGFGQSGVSAEQLETALTKLNDTLGDVLDKGAETPKEVATAFAKLGISLQDVLKSGGDLGVLLPQIAEGTKTLGTQAERTAVLKTLMGKSAAVLIPLFLGGADGLERMAKAAHDAGAVFDEEMAKALGDAKDKLDALDQVLTVQNARAFGQFAEQTVQAKQAWVDFVTALNDWGYWLDRQNWAGGVLSWLDQVIEKTRQVGPLSLIDAAKRLEGVDSSGGGLRVELNTPNIASPETAAGSRRGAWSATQQAQAKAASQLEKELAAVARWKEAWLQADGDVEEALAVRYQQQLQTADAEIKDATRLAEAKELIQATFALQLEKIERDKNQALNQAARELQEQLAKIDKDIATQHIQALHDSGRHAEAASEELKRHTADIETGGGTVDQDQLLANARLRIRRQLHDALAREDDVLGSALGIRVTQPQSGRQTPSWRVFQNMIVDSLG